MLEKLRKRAHPARDESARVVEPEAAPGPDEPAVDIQVLDVQRTYRPENRQADYVRVVYSVGDGAKELTVSVPWENMAQLRTELARWGREAGDEDILGFIVVPWAMDQVATVPDALPSGETLTLEFGDGPRPLAVDELLGRYGFQPAEAQPAAERDRPWAWEG